MISYTRRSDSLAGENDLQMALELPVTSTITVGVDTGLQDRRCERIYPVCLRLIRKGSVTEKHLYLMDIEGFVAANTGWPRDGR